LNDAIRNNAGADVNALQQRPEIDGRSVSQSTSTQQPSGEQDRS
jgi:hypothetical protein